MQSSAEDKVQRWFRPRATKTIHATKLEEPTLSARDLG